METYRQRINLLRVVLAAILFAGLPISVRAAPGPLKGAVPPVESAEPEASDREAASPDRGVADSAADRGRVAFQAASISERDAAPTSSYRASLASRTAAGSAGPADDQQAMAVPVRDTARNPRPEPEPLEFATAPYDIQASGRPRLSADSIAVYDGDPDTSWLAGPTAPRAYVWLDLGEERLVSGLRWFQPVVDGPVVIQHSNDRQTWTTVLVDEQPVAGVWQQAAVGQRVRYVRIVIGNQNQAAELAEVQIFGPPGDTAPGNVELAEAAPSETAERPPNVTITGGGERGRESAAAAVVVTPEPDSEAVEIQVNGEVARCTGGERCRVETPRPDVVEDCGDGTTTCTIRVGVSAGVAVCDESGGSGGRRSGNGGRCEAEASGGTITVSDVNR